MKVPILALVAMVLLVSSGTSARADTVTITGGSWENAWLLDGGVLTLVSDRFDVTAPWDCGQNTAGFCGFPFPAFSPGQVVDFSATALGHPGEIGTGTIDG